MISKFSIFQYKQLYCIPIGLATYAPILLRPIGRCDAPNTSFLDNKYSVISFLHCSTYFSISGSSPRKVRIVTRASAPKPMITNLWKGSTARTSKSCTPGCKKNGRTMWDSIPSMPVCVCVCMCVCMCVWECVFACVSVCKRVCERRSSRPV